jgi:porphobilinogen synthase
MYPIQRTRRNRVSSSSRSLFRETVLTVDDFIQPLFIVDGNCIKEPISALEGQFRFSLDSLITEIEEITQLGIKAIALFPKIDPRLKDPFAKESSNPQGLLPRAIRLVKDKFPELLVISDVAMDPYSSDGHDGVCQDGEILNDPTLEILAQMALTQAAAGIDIVAPSDMMDGRVSFIRRALDEGGYTKVGIMSYAAKYASAFYGPFRDALDSAPRFGDKKSYQMDPANAREAVREVLIDELAGADSVMVKPALAYLDVIKSVRQVTNLPVIAYNVSGEYAMVKSAARDGLIDEERVVQEILVSIKRAGADAIISYHSKQVAGYLKS